MGEVTVCSSLRGARSLDEVAPMAGVGAAAGAACMTGAAWEDAICIPSRGWRLMRTDSSPSEISSSEMPDSSSSSINFLTLRISIREPLQYRINSAQACDGGLERELVADRAQS